MTITQLTTLLQLQDLVAQSKFTVVYARTSWCCHCVTMTPIFNAAAANEESFGQITFCTVDDSTPSEGCREILQKYEIKGYPHFLVFKECELFCQISGFLKSKDFENILLFSVNFDPSSFNRRFLATKSLEISNSEYDSASSAASNFSFYHGATFNNFKQENSGVPDDVLTGTFVHVHERCRDPSALIDKLDNHEHMIQVYVFCKGDAPYASLLLDYISRCAASFKNHVVIHIIKITEPYANEVQDFVESNLLNYIPFAYMKREDLHYRFSEYSFQLDETIDFGKWIENCLNASRIIDSVLPEAKGHRVSDICAVEQFHKVLTKKKPVVILFHDSTAPSTAMYYVFKAVSALSELKGFAFFTGDYEELNEVATELKFSEGPVIAVYRQKFLMAETRLMMPFDDLKHWLFRLAESALPKLGGILDHPNLETNTLSSFDGLYSTLTSVLGFHSQQSHLDETHPFIPTKETSPRIRTDIVHSQGNFRDRENRGIFRRILSSPKPFDDPESDGVVVAEAARGGLQLGRANEGGSHFGVTLRPQTFENDLKIPFGVQFGPDRTENARFVSAYLCFKFGYCDGNGKQHSLTLKGVFPKDEKGESTVVHKGTSMESGVSAALGHGPASMTAEGKMTEDLKFSRVTAPRVMGTGVFTDTATWTFEEDSGEAGRNGLGSEYELGVILPLPSTALQDIRIRFWGRAILIYGHGHRPGSKQTLQIGSKERPFRRTLDLRKYVCYPSDEDGTRSIVSAP